MGVLNCLCAALAISAAQALDCSARGSAKAIAAGHDLSGKVAFFTGSDTGIGYETALALAGQGASIIIANHNASRGQAAVENITRITGNKNVEALELDLASFDNCRQVAASVLSKYKVVDFMIQDAGVSTPHGLTTDGFEYVMEVNYLGHFLLQQLLLPALRASESGKVIEVSSGASFTPCSGYPSNCTDIESITFLTKFKTPISNYGLTKFMMVYNTRELARREAARGSKVRAYAIRPGLVDTPLVRNTMPVPVQQKICSFPICVNGWRGLGCDTPCPMPASAGANSPTYIAVTDLPDDQDGSFYFLCKVIAPPSWENAAENQARLFDLSLRWTDTVANYSDVATFV